MRLIFYPPTLSAAAYANADAHARTGPTEFAITFDKGRQGCRSRQGGQLQRRFPNNSDVEAARYITHALLTAWVEDENGDVVCSHTFTAEDAAASFVCGVKDYYQPETEAPATLTPYEHCNLHGVWQGPTYDRAKEAVVFPGAFTAMNVEVFLKGTRAAPLKHEPAFSVDDDSFQIAVLGTDGAGLHPHAPPPNTTSRRSGPKTRTASL